MEIIERQFGERIRELRTARNLSQEELAFKAHMHRTYLSSIERGERNPSLKSIKTIADGLDISLSELFAFD